MENKKKKLTLSGIAKKSIENIELAKTQSKNSVVIEKKPGKFSTRSNFSRSSSSRSKNTNVPSGNFTSKSNLNFKTSLSTTNDYEKRKLAEQRATRRLKGNIGEKDQKGKTEPKKSLLEQLNQIILSSGLPNKTEGDDDFVATSFRSISSLFAITATGKRRIQIF